MYIIKNAVKSITRNKLRNVLLGIIVFVIAVSACVALSIREAADVAKKDALEGLTITAQISFDRMSAMEQMAKPEEASGQEETGDEQTTPEEPQGGFDRGGFDFDILQGSSLSLDEYLTYTEAQQEGDSYYYSGAFSLDATGDLLPYGTEEEDATEAPDEGNASSINDRRGGMENGQMGDPQAMGGRGGKRFQVNEGDFSVTGYSSYDAMLGMFDENGSYSVTEGEIFDEDSEALDCIISSELALYNDLEVGDTIVLCNPECEEETYSLKVTGIYTNETSSSQENNRFAMNDPANNIYISYKAAEAILSASEAAANTTTDSDGEETSVVLSDTLAFTYTFANVDHYNTFAERVYDLGLSEEYRVSSEDVAAFENSITPLETLSGAAFWFFVIVLAVGAVILVTLNIFNLRERKYEVGVLTAIGMKKSKVAVQFIFELFIVTFAAIILGAGVGAAASVPVTNALLADQIEKTQQSQETTNERFGFKDGRGEAPAGDIGGDPNAGEKGSGGRFDRSGTAQNYVNSVSTATNIHVILQLICVGILLTVISGLAALISIMRYEPLKILSDRT